MDLGRMLAQTADKLPGKAAVIFRDQSTTYRELDQRANQVANALIDFGVEPGDRVALYMHNLPISWRRTTESSKQEQPSYQ